MKRLKILFRRLTGRAQNTTPIEEKVREKSSRAPVFKPEDGTCRNCGTPFDSNYCPECGQTADVKRLTLRSWIDNIFKVFLDLDGTLVRTFRMLFTRPGQMINEYIAGQRKDYRNPFTLLIILCTIYGIILFAGKFFESNHEPTRKADPGKESKAPADQMPAATDSTYVITEPATPEQAKDPMDGFSERLDKMIDSRLSHLDEEKAATDTLPKQKPGKQKKKSRNPLDRLKEKSSEIAGNDQNPLQKMGLLLSTLADSLIFRSILMIPFYAFFTKLFFFRKTRKIYNLTELVFANAYITCQKLIIDILLFGVEKYLHYSTGWLVFLFYIFFPAWAYKGLFKVRWWSAIWRCSMIYIFSFTVLFFVAVSILALLAIIFVNDENAMEFVDLVLETTGAG